MSQTRIQTIESLPDVDSFPKNATLEVEVNDGKKEGKAFVRSKEGDLLAELNFQNDQLQGLCVYYDLNGNLVKEVVFENGIPEGWYCFYNENKISKSGMHKNGKVFSELHTLVSYPGYFEEVRGNEVISVCRFNENRNRDGLCTYYEDGAISSVVRFDDGVKRYEGEMKNGLPEGFGTFFDKNGEVLYEGEWKYGCIQISKRRGFDYESERECVLYENGMKKYTGEMKNGLPDGRGRYFDKDGTLLCEGYWMNGELYLNEREWFCYQSGKLEIRKTTMEKGEEIWTKVKTTIVEFSNTENGKGVIFGIGIPVLILILIILMSLH